MTLPLLRKAEASGLLPVCPLSFSCRLQFPRTFEPLALLQQPRVYFVSVPDPDVDVCFLFDCYLFICPGRSNRAVYY